ncbi:MAG: DUF4124 domain-containing protein [Porticoccaceae bacterium]
MINNDANTVVSTAVNSTAARLTPKLVVLAWLSCLSLLSANIPTVSADIIYRIEDKDGNVIFTDTPPPSQQAETVELSPTNTQPALVRPKAPKASTAEAKTGTSYTSIKLVQPTKDLTIPPGQLDIVAQIALEPQLQESHLVQFFMDGKPQGKPAATTSVSIGNLSRGAHQIRAQVIDQDKAVVARTGTVTIHVKRHSARS